MCGQSRPDWRVCPPPCPPPCKCRTDIRHRHHRELAFHGYVLSPGTLYPILHGLERDGLLHSRAEVVGKKRRRVYRITAEGQKTLVFSKARLWELFKEVFEGELSPDTAGHVEKALRVAIANPERSAGFRRGRARRPRRTPPRKPDSLFFRRLQDCLQVVAQVATAASRH